MATLYHVCLRPIKTTLTVEKFDPIFAAVGHWARMNLFNWYVWSNMTAYQIYALLAPHFDQQDSLVISPIDDPARMSGWAPQWFWDFKNNGWKNLPPG